MTVTYLGEDHSARSASNSLGVRTYTTAYKLEADAKTDRAYQVGSNVNLPFIGQVHEDDPLAFCASLLVVNTIP